MDKEFRKAVKGIKEQMVAAICKFEVTAKDFTSNCDAFKRKASEITGENALYQHRRIKK